MIGDRNDEAWASFPERWRGANPGLDVTQNVSPACDILQRVFFCKEAFFGIQQRRKRDKIQLAVRAEDQPLESGW